MQWTMRLEEAVENHKNAFYDTLVDLCMSAIKKIEKELLFSTWCNEYLMKYEQLRNNYNMLFQNNILCLIFQCKGRKQTSKSVIHLRAYQTFTVIEGRAQVYKFLHEVIYYKIT